MRRPEVVAVTAEGYRLIRWVWVDRLTKPRPFQIRDDWFRKPAVRPEETRWQARVQLHRIFTVH